MPELIKKPIVELTPLDGLLDGIDDTEVYVVLPSNVKDGAKGRDRKMTLKNFSWYILGSDSPGNFLTELKNDDIIHVLTKDSSGKIKKTHVIFDVLKRAVRGKLTQTTMANDDHDDMNDNWTISLEARTSTDINDTRETWSLPVSYLKEYMGRTGFPSNPSKFRSIAVGWNREENNYDKRAEIDENGSIYMNKHSLDNGIYISNGNKYLQMSLSLSMRGLSISGPYAYGGNSTEISLNCNNHLSDDGKHPSLHIKHDIGTNGSRVIERTLLSRDLTFNTQYGIPVLALNKNGVIFRHTQSPIIQPAQTNNNELTSGYHIGLSDENLQVDDWQTDDNSPEIQSIKAKPLVFEVFQQTSTANPTEPYKDGWPTSLMRLWPGDAQPMTRKGHLDALLEIDGVVYSKGVYGKTSGYSYSSYFRLDSRGLKLNVNSHPDYSEGGIELIRSFCGGAGSRMTINVNSIKSENGFKIEGGIISLNNNTPEQGEVTCLRDGYGLVVYKYDSIVTGIGSQQGVRHRGFEIVKPHNEKSTYNQLALDDIRDYSNSDDIEIKVKPISINNFQYNTGNYSHESKSVTLLNLFPVSGHGKGKVDEDFPLVETDGFISSRAIYTSGFEGAGNTNYWYNRLDKRGLKIVTKTHPSSTTDGTIWGGIYISRTLCNSTKQTLTIDVDKIKFNDKEISWERIIEKCT